MGTRLHPVVGQWYNHRDKGDLFQVVAIDEDDGTVEIQEFDGALDELDLDEWYAQSIEAAAQPEDWSGPVDDVEPDEFGYTDMNEQPIAADALDGAFTSWEEIVEEDDLDLLPEPSARPRAPLPGSLRRDH
jgi:hypothetical protein